MPRPEIGDMSFREVSAVKIRPCPEHGLIEIVLEGTLMHGRYVPAVTIGVWGIDDILPTVTMLEPEPPESEDQP